MSRLPLAALALSLAVLALAACGQSSADKAKSTVCDARADIAKQVDTLKGLQLSASAPDQVKQSLQAIGDDLKKIKNAQGDLSGQRKGQVQAANQAFEQQVKSIAAKVRSGLSLSTAKTQVSAAARQLATSYQQTFAKIDCS